MGKNQLQFDNCSYSSRDYTLLYKEINKTLKSLSKRDVSTIFNITFKGYTFNCLPFLLTGTSYFSENYRCALTALVASTDKIIEPFNFKEFKHTDGFDIVMFDCLYPALSDLGLRSLGAFLYKKNPKELIRVLYKGSVEVLEGFLFHGIEFYIKYSYKDICNTQAFSYHLCILWLLSLNPLLGTLLRKDLNRVGYKELIESFCPESSIHFKYIKGELTSKQLAN